MSAPTFIDGVLVHRNFLHNPPKFKFYRYPFPSTALRLGSCSLHVPEIRPLLPFGICILYTHAPLLTDTNRHIHLDFPTFFFGYWSGNMRQTRRTTHMVFFRDDLQPLHPKQAQVLWEFCDRLVFDIYSSVQFTHPWTVFDVDEEEQGQTFEEVVSCIAKSWRERCTVNSFSAFFDRFRKCKLLSGRESWRDVGSPYEF